MRIKIISVMIACLLLLGGAARASELKGASPSLTKKSRVKFGNNRFVFDSVSGAQKKVDPPKSLWTHVENTFDNVKDGVAWFVPKETTIGWVNIHREKRTLEQQKKIAEQNKIEQDKLKLLIKLTYFL